MAVQWTKATLRAKIIDMQTDIDRIMRNSNFSNIQGRVLLDYRKRAQSATRAFMQEHREADETHPVTPQDAKYILDLYDTYFRAIRQQRKDNDIRDTPSLPLFPALPALCAPAQHIPKLRVPTQTHAPVERSIKLIPSVQLCNIQNKELIDLDASRKQISIVPHEYTYIIPNLPGHEIHISISNEDDANVTVKQRCRPTHGNCLTDTNLPPHDTRILPLKQKIEDECTGFDIVQVDPQQTYPNNIKELLLILNFKYPEHEQEKLRKLLHKIKKNP
jgi:hypothetical protein